MAKINKAIQGEDIQGKGKILANACLLVLEEKDKVQKRGREESKMVQCDKMQGRRKLQCIESSQLCTTMLYKGWRNRGQGKASGLDVRRVIGMEQLSKQFQSTGGYRNDAEKC